MTQERIIWIATWAWSKGYDYETTMYSDYLKGNENCIDEVWEYVDELNEYGRVAFYEKYKEFKLY